MTDLAEETPGTDLEVAPKPQVVAPMAIVTSKLQMPAQTFDELVQQAETIARTNIVPKQYTGKPQDIIAAGLMGAEQGLTLMASLRCINVINGKPSFSAEAMAGKIRAAGHSLNFDHLDRDSCTVTGRHRNGDTMTFTYTMEDAADAELVQRTDQRGVYKKVQGKDPWIRYRRSMLCARATSQVARSLFGEIMLGMGYTPEEIGDDSWIPVPAEAVDLIQQVADEHGSVFDEMTRLYESLHEDPRSKIDTWLSTKITGDDGEPLYPNGWDDLNEDSDPQFLELVHRYLMKGHATQGEQAHAEAAGETDDAEEEIVDAEIVEEPEPPVEAAPDPEPAVEDFTDEDSEVAEAILKLDGDGYLSFTMRDVKDTLGWDGRGSVVRLQAALARQVAEGNLKKSSDTEWQIAE